MLPGEDRELLYGVHVVRVFWSTRCGLHNRRQRNPPTMLNCLGEQKSVRPKCFEFVKRKLLKTELRNPIKNVDEKLMIFISLIVTRGVRVPIIIGCNSGLQSGGFKGELREFKTCEQ